jgi:predicted nucleic acid-binding protein
MAKKIANKLDALIFIDTNILLDFYRIRRTDISMKYLEQIELHKNIIITSSQVEMEFKKNRQSAILESISEVKKMNNVNLSVPAILSDAKAVEMIKKSKKDIDEQQKRLKLQIEKILTNPNIHDPVYKSLQRVFSNKSDINLNRDNKVRFSIRNLAKKRFILGYPPRKSEDTSIGDSINWEWIIKCAEITGKHIIIVTRDTDYGAIYESESYLNDWLIQEFKQRLSQKRKIILTDKLSKAFQLVEIPVTKEMIEEEEKVLNFSFENYKFNDLHEAIKIMQENLKLKELQESFSKFQLRMGNIGENENK